MKLPLEIDGVQLLYEMFTRSVPESSGAQDRIVAIEDRTYRLRAADDGTFYTMFRIGGHQRSIRGSLDQMLRVVGLQHVIYHRYENRVRKLKLDAQRARDRQLNELAETT